MRLDRKTVALGMLLLVAGLAVIGGYRVVRGTHELAFSNEIRADIGPPVDFWLRWTEFHYVLQHQNPFDIYLKVEPQGPVRAPKAEGRRDADVDPKLGPVIRASYPPWTYLVGAVYWWLDYRPARLWFAACNILALVVMGWSTLRLLQRSDLVNCGPPHLAWAVCASVIAASHVSTVLHLGQLTLISVAFLMLSLVLLERGKGGWAGVALALAMVKFTIAAPFMLVPWAMMRWRCAFVSTAITLFSTIVVSWWVRTSPIEMLQQMSAIAGQIEYVSAAGPVRWVAHFGLSGTAASSLVALVTLGSFALTLWLCRFKGATVGYGLATIASMLWVHHKPYDEMVVAVLLVAMMSVTPTSTNMRRALLAAVILVWISYVRLGTPRLTGDELFIVLQILIWLPAGVLLLVSRRQASPTAQPAAALIGQTK